ncbi:MAG: biopolymer transporter ExbD [Planctomycetota bacterium]|nr:biopolymer transporter ExbD [Planctomycetota bacterium]
MVLRFVKESPRQETEHRLQMSSMIDIVFLLLVFFVMTFRITSQEGDFVMDGTEVTVPAENVISTNLPLRLQLNATPEGGVLAMSLNGERVEDLDELQTRLIGLDRDEALRDVVMTLDCDANLQYENLIAVLDHVTAYRDAIGQLKPLVTSTRLAIRR